MSSDGDIEHTDGMSAAQVAALRDLVSRHPDTALGSYPEAFAGVVYQCGGRPVLAAYDGDRCVQSIAEDDPENENPMDTFCYTALRALNYTSSHEVYVWLHLDDSAVFEDLPSIDIFEETLLGLVEGYGAVRGYDKTKCEAIVARRHGISMAEARSRFDELVLSVHKANDAPVFIDLVDGIEATTYIPRD